MPYQPNPGALPEACIVRVDDGRVTGFRSVHVRLHGGYDTRKADAAPWPASGGKPPTRWTLGRPPHPFDIAEWEIA